MIHGGAEEMFEMNFSPENSFDNFFFSEEG